jgi:hypothetical protein
MRVHGLVLIGLGVLPACSSLPATHVLLPSPVNLTAMEALSQRSGAVASVITADADEVVLVVQRGEPGMLAGIGLMAPVQDLPVAWPYDSLALVFYTDPAAASLSLAQKLPIKDRYPEPDMAGAMEEELSCAQLDTELARAAALRWLARERDAMPYTSGEKLALHAKHTVIDIGVAFLVVGALATTGGAGFGGSSAAPGGGTWMVDQESFRWAVSAIDARIEGLLRIKDQKSCAGRATLQADTTDLQLWHALLPEGTLHPAGSTGEHAWLARRTAAFDMLGPKAVAAPAPAIEYLPGETNPQVIGRVQWFPGVNFLAEGFSKGLKSIDKARFATLVLTDVSVILQVEPQGAGAVTRIPYADIATVTTEHRMLTASVVITQRSGHIDSVSVVPRVMVDREKTNALARAMRSKRVTTTHAEPPL